MLKVCLSCSALATLELDSLNSIQKATRLRSSIIDQTMHIRLGMKHTEDEGPEKINYSFQAHRPQLNSYYGDNNQ